MPFALMTFVLQMAVSEPERGELWATSPDGTVTVHREQLGYGVRVAVTNHGAEAVTVHVSMRLWFGSQTEPLLRERDFTAQPGRVAVEILADGPGLAQLTRADGTVTFGSVGCEVSEIDFRLVNKNRLLLLQYTRGGVRTTVNPERLAMLTDALHRKDAELASLTVELPIPGGPIDFDAPTNPRKVDAPPPVPADVLVDWTDARGGVHWVTALDIARVVCGEEQPEKPSSFQRAFGAARRSLGDKLKQLAQELCKQSPDSADCRAGKARAVAVGGTKG